MTRPVTRAGVIFSSAVIRWATTTPKSGVVALRMAARPLAIWLWPQAMRLKGTTLLMKPITKKAVQVSRSRGILAPVARTTR